MASANPQTMPLGSAAGTSVTAATTPDVPIDTTTSPARAPTPNAAAVLSPVPGPSTAFPSAKRPGRLGRSQHPGQEGILAQSEPQQIGPVRPGRRRPVAGAARVPAVGAERGKSADAPASRQLTSSPP